MKLFSNSNYLMLTRFSEMCKTGQFWMFIQKYTMIWHPFKNLNFCEQVLWVILRMNICSQHFVHNIPNIFNEWIEWFLFQKTEKIWCFIVGNIFGTLVPSISLITQTNTEIWCDFCLQSVYAPVYLKYNEAINDTIIQDNFKRVLSFL